MADDPVSRVHRNLTEEVRDRSQHRFADDVDVIGSGSAASQRPHDFDSRTGWLQDPDDAPGQSSQLVDPVHPASASKSRTMLTTCCGVYLSRRFSMPSCSQSSDAF